jgi:hypothetical protein
LRRLNESLPIIFYHIYDGRRHLYLRKYPCPILKERKTTWDGQISKILGLLSQKILGDIVMMIMMMFT